jgi:hypothetical protein
MSKTEREPFCANTDCKFHKYSVYVGVKYLEYVDPIRYSDASPVNDFYHVSHIKRDWIYKDGRPTGQFCNGCAMELLGLPREKDSDK